MSGPVYPPKLRSAAVGLAILLSWGIAGCSSGPGLFARNDRTAASKRREADRSKFVERKRVRPESDYTRDEADERYARRTSSGSKTSSRPRTAEEVIAARRRAAQEDQLASRSPSKSIPRTSTSKSSRPGESVARDDAARRKNLDSIDEDWFAEMPRSDLRTRSNSSTSGRATVAKSTPRFDDDPFRNAPIGKTGNTTSRNSRAIEPVNFDEDEEDDELEEELEEMEEERQGAGTAFGSLNKQPKTANSKVATTSNSSTSKRKFLDDFDEPVAALSSGKNLQDGRLSREARERLTGANRDIAAADKRLATTRNRTADRAQRTVTDWRQELDQADAEEFGLPSTKGTSEKTVASNLVKKPETAVASRATREVVKPTEPPAEPPAEKESFEPFAKSQGAVFNGELIIETSSLPNRFQRSSSGNNSRSSSEFGRVRPNSSTQIEINPGPPQPRLSGPISLQSLSEMNDPTSLTNATFERIADRAEGLSIPLPPAEGTESADAPRPLTSSGRTESRSEFSSQAPLFTVEDDDDPTSVPARGWKKMWLILGAVVVTIVGGLSSTLLSGLFRKEERLAPVPVRTPKP